MHIAGTPALRAMPKSGQPSPMARAPRTPLHDQVTAAAIMARLDGFEGYLENVARDTREARDETIKLTSRLTAENTQGELQKIWARIERQDVEHRADLANSYQRLAETMAKRAGEIEGAADALRAEVSDLQAWRNKLDGANGVVGWVVKHAPWLAALAVSGLALLRIKTS